MVKNARLVEENTRIKDLLQKNGITSKTDELVAGTDDASITAREYNKVIEQLDELSKRNQELTHRIKYLERKNVVVMQKNKDMKESVKAWQEYFEKHFEKRKTKTEGQTTRTHQKSTSGTATPLPALFLPSSPTSIAMRTPVSLPAQQRSSPPPLGSLSDTVTRVLNPNMSGASDAPKNHIPAEADRNLDHDVNEGDVEHLDISGLSSPSLPTEDGCADTSSNLINDKGPFLGYRNSDKISSSQTTVPENTIQENDTTPRATNAVDDAADEVEFVSERSLKRKRQQPRGHRVIGVGSSDGTPAAPARVKEELYSSPPPESAFNKLRRKETMDLDELGPNPITTPRRQRLMRVNSIHSNETGTLRDQRSSSAPFSGNSTKPEPTEDFHMAEVAAGSYLAVEADQLRAVSEPTDASLKRRKVLQQLDPNIVANRASEDMPNKRVRKEQARMDNKFNILAESGEMPPPIDRRKKALPPSLARAHFNERIRAAKSGVSSTKPALTTPKTAPSKLTAAQSPPSPPSSNRPVYTPSARPAQRKAPSTVPRTELVLDDRPIWRMSAFESARKTPAAPLPNDPIPQSHLRDKPIDELRMQDFKPNPAYNGGYTHAFTETVRRREDRLCLPGCTDPKCCGSTFRTLALAAAPLSSSQEDALLQDFLASAYDSFGLTQMSEAERADIVLQARTWKMATEHGKHRRTYEGRKTPPGFWRVDFPNTQEQEEDREKAVAMEQAEIRNRWLEAMRMGGRYIFADE